jgi:3-oxoacyl-[acyl-carrier-protein] synthase I
MSASPRVHHCGWGSSTAPVVLDTATINGLGTNPHQTWAFRRAESTAFVGSPFRLPNGKRVTFARVRQLEPRMMGAARLDALAERVLGDARAMIERLPREARIGVVLCLPERLSGEDRRAARSRIERLMVSRVNNTSEVITIARGHASLGYGLIEVAERMRERKLDFAVVLGVDSYYDADVMDDLVMRQQILDSDSHDAFVPGEAASLLVLARQEVARRLALSFCATIESVGTGEEVATTDNQVGLLGLGLSRIAVALCKKLKQEKQRLAWWISDATGETFRIQELQLAWPRAAHLVMSREDRFDLLPTHFGDLGAATMATALVLGVEGLRRGDPDGHYCLATGSSPGGSRGAVLIRAQ